MKTFTALFVGIFTGVLTLSSGEKLVKDFQYESNVKKCVKAVKQVTSNKDMLIKAEVDCRRSLK
jgi:hypothetical protein